MSYNLHYIFTYLLQDVHLYNNSGGKKRNNPSLKPFWSSLWIFQLYAINLTSDLGIAIKQDTLKNKIESGT